MDRRTLFIGTAAVAALLALAVLVLSSMPFSSDRGTDEFFLTVEERPDSRIDPAPSASPNAWKPIDARAFEGKVVPKAQPVELDTIELSANSVAMPYVVPFSPSLETFPEKSEQERLFRISADEIERAGDSIYYSGNVVIDHSEFRIEAEKVTMLHGEADSPRITAFAATVRQPLGNRSVSAASLTFDPLSVEVRLAGVTRFSTGDRKHSLEPDDILVLSESSYTVENPTTSQYASPVK